MVLMGVLASCAPYAAFKPATVQAPPDAFAKATRVLIEEGDSIETKDEAAGILITKWNEEESMGDKKRLRWKVTVTNGTLTVDSQCQFKITDPGPGMRNDWDNCGNQPGGRTEKANSIAAAIASHAAAAAAPPAAPVDAGADAQTFAHPADTEEPPH